MNQVTAIRHSISAYPVDALSEEGVRLAQARRADFMDFDVAVASGYLRTQQTLTALGYPEHHIMEHFDELVLADVNAPSAHEYVLEAHKRYPGLIRATAGRLIESLIETRKFGGENTLVVSHNLVLSSLLLELTGETDSFTNLSGMVLSVSDGGVSFLSRTKDIQS